MNKAIKKQNFILNVIHEKCPNCNKAQVFKKSKGLFYLPEMKDKCEACNYFFDREPGYFLGAMYISYGFAVLQGIATFLICHFAFPQLSTLWQAILVCVIVLIFGKKNYKLSRVLYIKLFPW